LPFLVVYTILVVYAERKLSAFMQDRLGPMEVGYYGILQTVADLLKLIQKEDIVPTQADSKIFKAAPLFIFAFIFACFSFLPLSPGWQGTSIPSALFLLLAILSLDVIGIVMAGWSSNNKYSTLGTLRAAAQIISYEVPLALSVLCACVICQSLDLQEISYRQGILLQYPSGHEGEQNFFMDVKSWNLSTTHVGGFLTWNVFRMPLLFVAWIIFFIASLAESNRAPFDLPEAESELVGGFHTEYSGFRWAVIMLAEYAMMLLVSFIGVILFWGSWNTPFPNLGDAGLADWTTGQPGTIAFRLWGIFWLISKVLLMVGLQIWVRWTFPRLRVDQLMSLSWKYLTPLALLILIICSAWKIFIA
jgi:NADH-quinone oxidoreductase subunit H